MVKKQYDSSKDERIWAGLMVRAQQGDKRAYHCLMTQLTDVTGAILRRRLSGQPEFIDDCTQEVLMAVHEARHTYESNRPFRPWFFSIVRYKTIDHLRRYYRHSKVMEEMVNETVDQLSIATTDRVDDQLTSLALMSNLPEPQREAIVLTKLEGKSLKEASQELAISESALKVRVHRGIGALKKRFKRDVVSNEL